MRFIASLAALLIFGYLGYYYWQTTSIPDTLDLSMESNLKSVPAMYCTLSNVTHSINGMLHLFHNAARFDITAPVNGKTDTIHLLVLHDDDTTYFWQDSSSYGARLAYGDAYSSVGLGAITSVRCSPWWFPNGSLFILPQSITFPRT